jgi:exodeoxyribonuclease VII large subunit
MAAEIVAWPLDEFHLAIYELLGKMSRELQIIVKDNSTRLFELIGSRALTSPESMLEPRYQYLDHQIRFLRLLSEKRFDTFREVITLNQSRLEALSPLAVLARGYSVSRSMPEKHVLRSIKDVDVGGLIETILEDGSIYSNVERFEKK